MIRDPQSVQRVEGNRGDKSWNRFFVLVQRDFKLWLFFMLALSFFRLLFIAVFWTRIGAQAGRLDVVAAVLNGLRFDSIVSTYWLIPSLLLSVACAFRDWQKAADRVRGICAVSFVLATAVIGCVGIEYFREFDNVFDHLLFRFYEDDTGAILTTIYSQHHPLLYFTLMAGFMAVGLYVYKRFFRREFVREEVFAKMTASHGRRLAVNILIALLFLIGMRGSVAFRPGQLKDAGITCDRVLNKAVLNSHIALEYALCDYLKSIGDNGLQVFLPDEDIVAACQEAYPQSRSQDDVDGYLEKTAAGPKTVPPRHIFMIIAESYDSWPMLDEYRSLHISEQGRRLAREGLYVQAFLPTLDSTETAYIGMTAGLPSATPTTQYQQAAKALAPLSLPDTMRRLGYRTRLFYSGYLSWCNLGDTAEHQGVEEVYGAAHIAQWSVTNEWGVDDEHLYDFILKTIADDRPSFNIILTTSNHPPYSVDLKAQGCPLTEIPPDLKQKFDMNPGKMLPILGHRWYSDRCLGDFVSKAERKMPRALFAISGDHYSRRFINSTPTVFERSAVPLILYGKEVLKGLRLPEGVAGSHIDIQPALIELAAPRGFKYHAAGQDLLTPQKRFLGFSLNRVIGADFMLDFNDAENPEFCAIPGRELPAELPEIEPLIQAHHAVNGVAWWRVKRGPTLPSQVLIGNKSPASTQR